MAGFVNILGFEPNTNESVDKSFSKITSAGFMLLFFVFSGSIRLRQR